MNEELKNDKNIDYGTDRILIEVTMMELAEIRNELERTATRLADFRGSL